MNVILNYYNFELSLSKNALCIVWMNLHNGSEGVKNVKILQTKNGQNIPLELSA